MFWPILPNREIKNIYLVVDYFTSVYKVIIPDIPTDQCNDEMSLLMYYYYTSEWLGPLLET